MLQCLLSGVSIGAIYGLLGLALALSFYVTRVINFAQGQMLTTAIVVAASLSEAGYNPWIGVALGPIAACAIGVASYFVAVRPILKADRFSFGWMVSTLGFGLALENAIAYVVGPRSRAFPPLLNDIGVHIGGALLTAQQILAIAVAAVIVAALELVRRRTLFGKVGMATAFDPEMAECIGANTMMVAAVTFAISGVLAGIAGGLIAPRTFANPYLGGTFNTFGFVAMMIGGAENPAFAMYGGLLLGVMSEGANTYINSQASDWFPFVVLVLVLLISPKGIFSLRVVALAQLPYLIKQIPLSLKGLGERITARSIERPIAVGRTDEIIAAFAESPFCPTGAIRADRGDRNCLFRRDIFHRLGGLAGPRPHSRCGDLRHSRHMPGCNGGHSWSLFAGSRRLLRHRRLSHDHLVHHLWREPVPAHSHYCRHHWIARSHSRRRVASGERTALRHHDIHFHAGHHGAGDRPSDHQWNAGSARAQLPRPARASCAARTADRLVRDADAHGRDVCGLERSAFASLSGAAGDQGRRTFRRGCRRSPRAREDPGVRAGLGDDRLRRLVVLLSWRRIAQPVQLVDLPQRPGHDSHWGNQHDFRPDYRGCVRQHVSRAGSHQPLAPAGAVRGLIDLGGDDCSGRRRWRREAGLGASEADFARGREGAGASSGFPCRRGRRRGRARLARSTVSRISVERARTVRLRLLQGRSSNVATSRSDMERGRPF